MLGSVRQRVAFVSHVLLVSMVAVAWYYVLVAGKVVTLCLFIALFYFKLTDTLPEMKAGTKIGQNIITPRLSLSAT